MQARLTISAVTVLAVLLCGGYALANPVDRTLQVQGLLLTSSGVPATGTFTVTLRLYAAGSGGAPLYTEPSVSVTVASGVFDATVGPVPLDVLSEHDALWLETQVGSDVLDRQPLRTVPYAVVADVANTALVATGVQCDKCVQAGAVAFDYAAGVGKDGDAAGLDCDKCVDPTDLALGAVATVHLQNDSVTGAKAGFNYAGSKSKGGAAEGLECGDCVDGNEIVAGVELRGSVGVKGSLAACTGGIGGCQMQVGAQAMRDAGDGRLTIQSASGLRVRTADGAAFAPAEAGAVSVNGGLSVTGGASVAGPVVVGAAAATQGASLDVAGAALVRGSLVAVGSTGGQWEMNENQLPMHAELPYINPNPLMTLWPDGAQLPVGYDQTDRLTVARTSGDTYGGAYAADLTVASGQTNGYIAQDLHAPKSLRGRRVRLVVAAKPVTSGTSLMLYLWQRPAGGTVTNVFQPTFELEDGWHEYSWDGVIADDTDEIRIHVYVAGGTGKRALVDAFYLYPVDLRGSVNLATESGRVGVGTQSPVVKLDVAGGVRIGSEDTCDATTEGTLRYNSTTKSLELCDGASWSAALSGYFSPNDLIVCRFTSTTFMPINGANTHTFTAAECGGKLPDASYRGVLAKTVQCGRDEDWYVVNAGESGGPGVFFWISSACMLAEYPTDIEVVFVGTQTQVPSDVVQCKFAGSFNQGAGNISRPFTASECGGSLPDSSYLGMMSHASQCGSDEDWEVRWPGETNGPGMAWWMGSACGGATLGGVFARLTSRLLKDAIVCDFYGPSYTPPASPGNALTVRPWTISECGGKLPDVTYEGVLVKGIQCGPDEDWAVIDADEPGGPAMAAWNPSPCAYGHYKAIYLKK